MDFLVWVAGVVPPFALVFFLPRVLRERIMMPPLWLLRMALRWELLLCLMEFVIFHLSIFLHLAHQFGQGLRGMLGKAQHEGTVLQPLLGGVDDGSFAQDTGLAFHIDEMLNKASKSFHPPLLDSEEVS